MQGTNLSDHHHTHGQSAGTNQRHTYGVMGEYAPVADPGLMYSLPSISNAVNSCVWPVVRVW